MNYTKLINELLNELSYRVGIVDLKNKNQQSIISEILSEWGEYEAKQIIMEFLTNEAPADTEGDDKDYTHLGAGIYVRKGDEDKDTAQKYKKDDSGSLKAISDDEYQKTKATQGQDGEKAAATTPQNQQGGDIQQAEEPPKGTSLKQGGYDKIIDKEAETRKKIDNEKNGISSTKSLVDIQDENTKSLESFIQKGFTDSEGAPGSPGSMLNEIISITSATNVLNSGGEFDFESQLESNINSLKGTGLANDNDGNNPASGVTKSEAQSMATKYGVSIGVASKAIIATRAAKSKQSHIQESIISKNKIQNSTSVPFFGDRNGMNAQEEFINSTEGKVFLGNTMISKEEAIKIIKSGGKGANPSDTAIFVKNEDTGDVHMVFFSDKDNVNAIVAQSSLVAEVEFKKTKVDTLVKSGKLTQEQGDKIKLSMDDAVKEYIQLEEDLNDVVNGPVKHLQNVETSRLVDLAKTLSKGAKADKYWNGDKNTRGIAQVMTTSKKHMAYLPEGHSTPPTDLEMMRGFVSYANDSNNTLTKVEQRVITDLSNSTDGPKLGAQIGEIRKRTVDADLNLIKKLDEQTISIDGKQVGVGTLLEAESVVEKLHLEMMFGGAGVYQDSDAFYQESGGTKVDKKAMERCLPFKDKNDMLSHFEVGEERETTKRGGTTVTGASKIVYAITKDGKKYPIGEKKQRSKTGELGKLQTVYNYHPDVQKCFKSKQS